MGGGGRWGHVNDILFIIYFKENKQTEREKEQTIQVFVLVVVLFLLSAVWYFKPNNM